jgi:hypothetical protein
MEGALLAVVETSSRWSALESGVPCDVTLCNRRVSCARSSVLSRSVSVLDIRVADDDNLVVSALFRPPREFEERDDSEPVACRPFDFV